MVCDRCIRVVKDELENIGIYPCEVRLGKVTFEADLENDVLKTIDHILQLNGFEIIDDRKSKLIESIKNLIIKTIHHEDLNDLKIVWSEFLSRELHFEYKYLSQLYSSVEGITIEHFIILHKIEKAKELLVYNELTLSQIAWELGYSSVAHLSNQFKKVTGLTPGKFKQIGKEKRKSIDNL